MKSITNKRRRISKVAGGDQHGIFQHFQSNTTDYATRERYLSQRGGEASMGRDTESLYNLSSEGDDSRVPTEYVAPHLSTRYSPDRVGIQAQRISDGVYQDPYTNKMYDYNEGFKTEDGRAFPGGSASLQSSLMRAANILDESGLTKQANTLDSVLERLSANKEFIKLAEDKASCDAEGVTDSRKMALAYTISSLVSVSNKLDGLGLKSESDALDLTIKNLASEAREERDLSPIADMASSLDEYGLHYVSDSLDAWLKKNR